MSIMAAGVATVANAAGILKNVADGLERITLRQQINRLIGGNTKVGERLRNSVNRQDSSVVLEVLKLPKKRLK